MRRALLASTLLLFAGCGASSHSDPLDAGPADSGAQTFVALEADLANYASWEKFTLPPSSFTGSPARWVYLNHRPPPGSTAWPVGTILVKEQYTIGIHPVLQVDAMVKRGGGFNIDDGGARDWEWMGLTPSDAGATIAWRGTQPPPGAGYSGPIGNCNACHGMATDNDYVQPPSDDAGYWAALPLELSSYR